MPIVFGSEGVRPHADIPMLRKTLITQASRNPGVDMVALARRTTELFTTYIEHQPINRVCLASTHQPQARSQGPTRRVQDRADQMLVWVVNDFRFFTVSFTLPCPSHVI